MLSPMLNQREKLLRVVPFAMGVLGAGAALILTYIRGFENTHYPDAPLFISQAESILRGWNYMTLHPLVFEAPLGFPVLISSTFLINGGTSLALFKIFLSLCHGISTFLVASIGIRMGLPRLFWILAALFFSLDPFMLSAATDIQVEPLVTLIVLFWAYLFLLPSENSKRYILQIICFPISGFIAITFRPNILIPFLLLSILMFRSWFTNHLSRSLMLTSISIFFSLLTVYEVFLSRLYGGFVFLAANGGLNTVLTCRDQFLSQYLGFISTKQNSQINHSYYAYLQNLRKDLIARQPNISFSQLNHEYLSTGLATCLENPIKSSYVLIVKSIALWRPYTVFGAYGTKVALISLFIWLPLTLATVWYLTRSNLTMPNRILRNYFLILSIGFTISLIPSSTQIRHRVAFVEPFYWLFAAYMLGILFSHWRKSRSLKILT